MSSRRAQRAPIGPMDYTRRAWVRLTMLITFMVLYAPIATLIIFSFNDSRRNIVWKGFTTKYYVKAWNNDGLIEAFTNSLTIAIISTLIISMSSTATCERASISLPLELFNVFTTSDGSFLDRRIREVLSRLPIDTVYGFFGATPTRPLRVLDFDAVHDIPRIIEAAVLSHTPAANNETDHALFISSLDVCMLGLYVRYMELVPTIGGDTSERCTSVWAWLERADTLRAAIAQNASCGLGVAATELETITRPRHGSVGSYPLCLVWTLMTFLQATARRFHCPPSGLQPS